MMKVKSLQRIPLHLLHVRQAQHAHRVLGDRVAVGLRGQRHRARAGGAAAAGLVLDHDASGRGACRRARRAVRWWRSVEPPGRPRHDQRDRLGRERLARAQRRTAARGPRRQPGPCAVAARSAKTLRLASRSKEEAGLRIVGLRRILVHGDYRERATPIAATGCSRIVGRAQARSAWRLHLLQHPVEPVLELLGRELLAEALDHQRQRERARHRQLAEDDALLAHAPQHLAQALDVELLAQHLALGLAEQPVVGVVLAKDLVEQRARRLQLARATSAGPESPG